MAFQCKKSKNIASMATCMITLAGCTTISGTVAQDKWGFGFYRISRSSEENHITADEVSVLGVSSHVGLHVGGVKAKSIAVPLENCAVVFLVRNGKEAAAAETLIEQSGLLKTCTTTF